MALLKSGTRVYGFATIDTTLSVDGNDVATSNTTGALKVAGGIGTKGNIFSSGNITAKNADLGNLVVANYITGTLTTSAQPNITSVGNLSSLIVTGNVNSGNLTTVDATVTGNLIVSGQAIYANVTTLNIKDSIIEQGGNVDGVPLNANAGKDLGSLLHYYTSAPIDAFMGWKVANNEFVVASNASISNGVVTVNELGNLRAKNFVGNATGSAATVTANAQPNITSLGTLTNLNVTGNVDAANLIGTIKTSTQPNITSVGNLSGLKVEGITDLGVIGNIKIYGGNGDQVLRTDGTGNLFWSNSNIGAGNALVGGSNTQVFFNNGTETLGTSTNFTFDTSTNTLTITNIASTNLSVSGNVTSKLVPNANGSYDLGSPSQRWRDLYLAGGNLYVGNAKLSGNGSSLKITTGNIQADYFEGNGSLLTGIVTPVITNGTSNVKIASANSNVTVSVNGTNNVLDVGTANTTIKGDFLPQADNTYSLGSSTNKWKDLYISGNSIFLGAANIKSVGERISLDQLFVAGETVLPNANITITDFARFKLPSGPAGYILRTDGQGNVSWSAAANAEQGIPGGNTGAVQFNSNGSLAGSSNLTFNNTTGTLTATNFAGNANGLSNIAGANVVGSVPTALTVTTNAQPNITSVGTLTSLTVSNTGSTGNVIADNANLGNAVRANYFIGDGSRLTNLPSGLASALVTSNVINLTSGADLGVDVVYGNTQYPGGVFTIYQLGPVSFTSSTAWASGGSSKNQYANFLAGTVNTQDIRLTLTLANANFAIANTDTITIGGSVITGANITGLGISGTGGTYTISSSLVNANVQLNSSSTVSANLTTSRGVKTASGTTLTTVAPVAYTVNSISGSFPVSSVPYWNLNQSFNWSVSVTGTTASGNLTYSGGGISTTSLSSTGQTSGSSGSINSTSSYIITTSDYTGAGLNGYGTRTIPNTVNGTVNAATKYYPLFWKITSNSTLPTFTTTDSRNSNNFAVGQSANTSSTTTDYLFMAIPNTGNSASLQNRTFKHVFGGFDIVDVPTVTGTQAISANGESYNYSIYGFTSFSAISSIIVTS